MADNNIQVNICLGCMKNMEEEQKICPSCGYDNSKRQNAEELLPEGTVLFRKYLIGRVIGRGGFGVTYVGYDLDLQLKVAIKEYFPIGICIRSSQTYNVKTASALEDSSVFSKGCDVFLDEARTLAKINSPYTVHVRDFFREHGTAYIVMDYAEGVTLKAEMKKNGGRLPPERVLSLMEPLIRELDILHGENIIHRDIKPENIMLVRDRRGEHLVLLDFGSARTYVSKESKSLTSIVTQGFSPLEQYSSISRQGSYTDVYALCATIYNAITGEIPPSANDRNIDGVPLKSITDCGIMIAPEAEAAIMHGLALRSADRTQTMEQLLEELKGNSTAGGSRIGKEIRTEKSKQPSKVTTDGTALKKQTGEQKAFSSKQMEARNEGKRQEKTSAAPKTALAVAAVLLLFTGIYLALTRNSGSETAKPEAPKETVVVSTETPSSSTPTPTSTPTQTPIASAQSTAYEHPNNGWGPYTYADGSVYEGFWKDNKQNGQGKMTYPNGSVYEGEWNNNLREGRGIMKYANGNIYEGEWKDDLQNGQGTMTYADGRVLKGTFKDGEYCVEMYSYEHPNNGWGPYTYADGSVYEGFWKDSMQNGQGKMTYPNGSVYEGEWKNNLREGRGTMKYANGNIYEGEWKEDLQNGQGTMTYADGKVLKGTFKDGEYCAEMHTYEESASTPISTSIQEPTVSPEESQMEQKYQEALKKLESSNLEDCFDGLEILLELGDYKDAKSRSEELINEYGGISAIAESMSAIAETYMEGNQNSDKVAKWLNRAYKWRQKAIEIARAALNETMY